MLAKGLTAVLTAVSPVLVSCSDYTYFLNVTVAGVYNQSYPGTCQAFKVGASATWRMHGFPPRSPRRRQEVLVKRLKVKLWGQPLPLGLQAPNLQPLCPVTPLPAQAYSCKGVYFEDSGESAEQCQLHSMLRHAGLAGACFQGCRVKLRGLHHICVKRVSASVLHKCGHHSNLSLVCCRGAAAVSRRRVGYSSGWVVTDVHFCAVRPHLPDKGAPL